MFSRWIPAVLLGLLASVAAASDPVPARMTTRVYAIADLVVPPDMRAMVVRIVPDATNCSNCRSEASVCCQQARSTEAGPPCPTCPTRPGHATCQTPRTNEKQLMRLISATVAPGSWNQNANGGQMEFHADSMSLVVKATPRVHDELDHLLTSLRQMHEVTVGVEYRLVRVTATMLSRLGLTPNPTSRHAEFLDDNQVAELMKKMQDDPHTNILQAPRMMVQSGQSAVVEQQEKKSFVVDVEPISVNGRPAFTPKMLDVEIGHRLGLTPLVSADRRFVRLSVEFKSSAIDRVATVDRAVKVPMHANCPTGECQSLPITVAVQRPNLSTHAINTDCILPSGCSIVFCAGKAKGCCDDCCETCEECEGCSDCGCEMFARVPYLNRLFKKPVKIHCEDCFLVVILSARVHHGDDTTGAEESADRVHAEPLPIMPRMEMAADVAELMRKYHAACHAGQMEYAERFARQALALDPACFAKARPTGQHR
jgi:hypothetical protein